MRSIVFYALPLISAAKTPPYWVLGRKHGADAAFQSDRLSYVQNMRSRRPVKVISILANGCDSKWVRSDPTGVSNFMECGGKREQGRDTAFVLERRRGVFSRVSYKSTCGPARCPCYPRLHCHPKRCRRFALPPHSIISVQSWAALSLAPGWYESAPLALLGQCSDTQRITFRSPAPFPAQKTRLPAARDREEYDASFKTRIELNLFEPIWHT